MSPDPLAGNLVRCLLVGLVGILAPAARGIDETPPAVETSDPATLAKKLQNPVAALISVPFQSNFEWGSGPGSNGFKYTLNFQPVIPILLSEE